MSTQADITVGAFQEAKGLYRAGGLAALAIGAAYFVIIALYISVGEAPAGGEARLVYLAGKTGAWWGIVGTSVLTNFLYVPVALALYVALKRVHQAAMLFSGAFIGLFVLLENAVNWTIYGSLNVLSGVYAAATSEAQRAAVVAAATFASAVLESPLAAVWAIGTLSFAFLVIGWVMLKSTFGRPAAYLGILTGLFGIVAVAGVDMAVYLNAFGALIWLMLVGYRLYRLSLP